MAMSESDHAKVKTVLWMLGGLVPEDVIIKVLKRIGIGPGKDADKDKPPAMDRARPCETTEAEFGRRFPHAAKIGLS